MTYPPMRMELETDRLALRPWTPADAQWLNSLHRERELGPGDAPSALEVTKRVVADIMERAPTTGISVLPVVRKADGLAIGYCGFIEGRASLDEPEIAYELFRAHHGRGYATEAARAVVAAAADTGRSRLWSTVGVWNAPSLRVLEKLGFQRRHTTEEASGSVVRLTLTLGPGAPSYPAR
jgi:RimJ/RimL family protein N-acetyltransferase